MKLLSIALVLALCSIHQSAYATTSSHCTDKASSACYFTFNPGGSSKKMHFYASLLPQDHDTPRHALLVIHGYARDAKTLFNTTLLVVKHAHALHDTLVVAPVFHVVPSAASKCQTSGVPRAQSDDVQWTCRSWLIGSSANNDPHISAFTATDALLNALKIRWPSLQTVTIAGFSAGAQMVQHYIGFAAPAPTLALHYVVSNPGIWLYFDPQRPQPLRQGKRVDWSSCASGVNGLNHCQIALTTPIATCPNYNRWPYGTEQLPAHTM